MNNCIAYSADFHSFIIPDILQRPRQRSKSIKKKPATPEPAPPASSAEFAKTHPTVALPKKPLQPEQRRPERPSAKRKQRVVSKAQIIADYSELRKALKESTGTKPTRRHESAGRQQSRQSSEYKVGEVIGKGRHAAVHEGRNKHGSQLAFKMYRKRDLLNKSVRDNFLNELAVLKEVDHPHLVRFIDQFSTSTHSCIVTQLAKGVTLQQLLQQEGKLGEGVASFLTKQLLEAVAFLHERGIAHRDIQANNLVVDQDYRLRLVDYGLAQHVKKCGEQRSGCGSPKYLSPEAITRERFDPLASDVWAVGVILFLMASGRHPFYSGSLSQLYHRIKAEEPDYPRSMSYQCRRTVALLLSKEPGKRPAAEKALQLNWLQ